MLSIYLLDHLDKSEGKKNELGITLREKHMENLISRVNTISHRGFIEFEKLEEKIKVYDPEQDSLVDFGVVEKVDVEGDHIDWLAKIASHLTGLDLIRKSKACLSPQDVKVLIDKLPGIKNEIGEGVEAEINEKRYGERVKVRELRWSMFWDALEYSVNVCSRHDLYLYIPMIETFLEKA